MLKRGTSESSSGAGKRARSSTGGSTQLTVMQRLQLIRDFDADSSHGARARLAQRYGVSIARVSQIIKGRDEVERQAASGLVSRSALRVRAPKFPEVERRLLVWIQQQMKVPLSMSMICDQAARIAEECGCEGFTANKGWFTRFKQRVGLTKVVLDGESVGFWIGAGEEGEEDGHDDGTIENENVELVMQRIPPPVRRPEQIAEAAVQFAAIVAAAREATAREATAREAVAREATARAAPTPVAARDKGQAVLQALQKFRTVAHELEPYLDICEEIREAHLRLGDAMRSLARLQQRLQTEGNV